jgi:hypothetical protein
MLTTSELFGDADWDFTPERSVAESPKDQKQAKLREAPHAALKVKNRFRSGDSANVCTESRCFTGMVIALPLSLIVWAGLIVSLYLLVHCL